MIAILVKGTSLYAAIINFINRMYISIIIFIFLLIAFYIPPLGAPNFLGITNISAYTSLTATIVGSVSSILGIITAILLVAFELFRKTYSFYAFKEFFQVRELQNLFQLYIGTIIVGAVSQATTTEPLSSRNLNLGYLSIFLFIICLFVLFPYSKKIITSANAKENIKKIVNQINYESVNQLELRITKEDVYNPILTIENNPIFVLSEIIIRTVRDGDRLTPRLILYETTGRLIYLIEKSTTSIRDIINGITVVYRNALTVAVEVHSEGVLLTILEVIEKVQLHCSIKKIAWYELIELNQFWKDLIEKAIRYEYNTVFRRSLWSIESTFKNNIETNTPMEEEIWTFNKTIEKPDHEKSLQWNHVSEDFIRMAYTLTELAIKQKRESMIISGISIYTSIISDVINSNLGDLQKKQIVSWVYFYSSDLISKTVDENIFSRVSALTPFNMFTIENIIDKLSIGAYIPLKYFGQTLIKLAEKGVLDELTLNEFGATGRTCASNITKNESYAKAVIYIARIMNSLRSVIEDNPNFNQRVYRELYEQLSSLLKWMNKDGIGFTEIINEIASLTALFKIETDNSKEIEWPS